MSLIPVKTIEMSHADTDKACRQTFKEFLEGYETRISGNVVRGFIVAIVHDDTNGTEQVTQAFGGSIAAVSGLTANIDRNLVVHEVLLALGQAQKTED